MTNKVVQGEKLTGDRFHVQLSPRSRVRDDKVADGHVSQRLRHL